MGVKSLSSQDLGKVMLHPIGTGKLMEFDNARKIARVMTPWGPEVWNYDELSFMKDATPWKITKETDDFIDGEQVLRISIGGNAKTGYYIVYRGVAAECSELLDKAAKNFEAVLKGEAIS